jgi:transcriptional regulator with XRE-family HTH domain
MTTETATGSAAPRYLLGRHLRAFRECAGLSLREASRRLEMGQSQVSRVENGEAPVRASDIELACQVYGVTDPDQIRALMDLARDTRQPRAKNWLSSYADVVSENFVLFVGLEAAASSLAWYETDYVAGLLQTRDYAYDLMRAERLTGKELDPDLLERRLEIRLNRQRILERESGAPELAVVLSEAALLRVIGGAQTMADQLSHLLEMAKRPGLEIRVMPLDREHAGLATGQFSLLDFPSRGPLNEPSGVYVDGYLGFFWADKPAEVDLYRTAWRNLWETALSERQSADFIKQRLKEMRDLT